MADEKFRSALSRGERPGSIFDLDSDLVFRSALSRGERLAPVIGDAGGLEVSIRALAWRATLG